MLGSRLLAKGGNVDVDLVIRHTELGASGESVKWQSNDRVSASRGLFWVLCETADVFYFAQLGKEGCWPEREQWRLSWLG